MTAYKTIKEKVQKNLVVCAKQIKTWDETAILLDGPVREYASEYSKQTGESFGNSLNIVKSIVYTLCIDFVVQDF